MEKTLPPFPKTTDKMFFLLMLIKKEDMMVKRSGE